MTPYYVLRATQPRGSALPGWLYWNGQTRLWDEYESATRYDNRDVAAHLAAHGPETGSTIDVVELHPVDRDGYPYAEADGFRYRLTQCCAAATSVMDGPLYCKSCYSTVDWAYDQPPIL
jgi:hypothetical protein